MPKDVPVAAMPRSGVATGVGVVCESERTGKTEEKTRLWWSMLCEVYVGAGGVARGGPAWIVASGRCVW